MKNGKLGFAVKLVFAVFMIFCLFTLFKLKIELDTLKEEYSECEAVVSEYQAHIAKLENKLKNDTLDEDYVEDVAKDKLNLVLPEEIIFYNDIQG